MTFYRYYADKEGSFWLFSMKESEFMQDLAQITADKASAREKLLPCSTITIAGLPETLLHVYPRCLNGASLSPAIREQCFPLQSLTPLAVLRYSPAGVKTRACRAGRHDDGDARRWLYRRPAGRVRGVSEIPAGDGRLERGQRLSTQKAARSTGRNAAVQ